MWPTRMIGTMITTAIAATMRFESRSASTPIPPLDGGGRLSRPPPGPALLGVRVSLDGVQVRQDRIQIVRILDVLHDGLEEGLVHRVRHQVGRVEPERL